MAKIAKVEPIVLKVPFTDGSSGTGLMPQAWTKLEIVLVRVETDDGLVGWGESFGYFCSSAVAAAVRDMVAPVAIGQDAGDPRALNRMLQQRLHLHGRYGITIFAISGLDIALWDIAGKRSGTSLTELLGGNARSASGGKVPAYASLMRYGDPVLVERFAAKAASEGYADVKLHEIRRDTIGAGRKGVGAKVRLTTDINCNWSVDETRQILPYLKEIDLFWLEEPIFPPEDWETLMELGKFGIAISAGENACTSVEFSRLIPAVTYAQPSVTKVGGVSEVIAIADMAKRLGRTLMPHSPYFGPGYWATVHLVAARAELGLFEYLYVTPDAWLSPAIPRPAKGVITPPTAPGLGFEPDQAVLERYRVA
ncbi:MAG TPA: mandelate racemase/muconate lactonizing enzyme family protein [Hyphomicrobiaceae bacterium]|nr:mandelate racemase/muconate lactonizing enzyme family protein [Hyphomicrobiaceae bacterium]